MADYQIGDQPTVTGYFTAIDTGLPANPSAITIQVRKPDGTVTSYTQADATNPAVGTWRFSFPAPLDQDGLWRVRFAGTAGVVAAAETSFSVDCSVFAEAV